MTKNDEWWAGLTVAQKERIATKAAAKANPDQPVNPILYPACTVWWNSIDDDRKQAIHDHCTDSHGYLLKEWSEGRSMSY